MTMISSYYAQVGVGIDKSSLAQVQGYLDSIHKKLVAFQTKASRTTEVVLKINNFAVNHARLHSNIRAAMMGFTLKINDVSVNAASIRRSLDKISTNATVRFDAKLKGTKSQITSQFGPVTLSQFNVQRTSLQRALSSAVNDPSIQNAGLRISKFTINQKSLYSALNQALSGSAPKGTGMRVGAVLSQASLAEMRRQMRDYLSNVTINPRINPRMSNQNIRQPAQRQPHQPAPKSTNPYHNPMLVGGGIGALMRFGAFALPGYAGVWGFNALAEQAATLQSQSIALQMTAGETTRADGTVVNGAYYEKFIDQLGERLGKRTQDIMPGFTQWLAAARGTPLEQHLESSFAGLSQYGAVMGLNDEQMKLSIKAFTQMVSKQQVMAEELKGQAAEHLPPVVRLAASVVAPDLAPEEQTKKLFELMEKGQLNPNTLIPALTKKMEEESRPMMEMYWNSLRFNRGRVSKESESWMKSFLGGGAEEGITSVFESVAELIKGSMPYAERMGEIFGGLADGLAAGILGIKELGEWVTGREQAGNWLTHLFGKSEDNEMLSNFKALTSTITAYWSETIDIMSDKSTLLGGALHAVFNAAKDAITELANWFMVSFGNILELLPYIFKGDWEGLAKTRNVQNARDAAMTQAKSELGDDAPYSEVKKRADEIFTTKFNSGASYESEKNVTVGKTNYILTALDASYGLSALNQLMQLGAGATPPAAFVKDMVLRSVTVNNIQPNETWYNKHFSRNYKELYDLFAEIVKFNFPELGGDEEGNDQSDTSE